MDLLTRLKDTEPPRPEAYELARMALRSRMAESGPGLAPMPGTNAEPTQTRARHRRLTRGGRRGIGFGVGIGLAAAAVAAVLVVTSTPQPSANTGHQSAASKSAPASAKAKPSAAPLAVNSQLMSLASYIESNGGPLPGDATLVIRTQTNGDSRPVPNYDLYTDSGDYYWASAQSGLPEAIAGHENLADGSDARKLAAALYAVNGDLTIARERMIDAMTGRNPFGIGLRPAAKRAFDKEAAASRKELIARAAKLGRKIKLAEFPPTGKQLQIDLDNYLWNDSIDALTEWAGNPQVRVGVLRLLATAPEVTVASSTTHGQPTLTLTAGKVLFAGIEGQVVTISAKTGIPISSVGGNPGQAPSSVVTFQVSRVTVANIAAGKF
jgi:hypothetical protein